jgi:hypothetical protein
MPQVPTPQPMMPSPSPVQRGPNVNMDALMRMREMMMQRRQPQAPVAPGQRQGGTIIQAPAGSTNFTPIPRGRTGIDLGPGQAIYFDGSPSAPVDPRFLFGNTNIRDIVSGLRGIGNITDSGYAINVPEDSMARFQPMPPMLSKPTPPSDPSRVDMRWEQFRNNTSPIRTADWREGRDYIRDQNTGEIIHLDNNGFPIVRNPRKVNSDGTRVAPPGIKNPFMDNQLFQRQPATPFPPPMQQPPMMPPQMTPQPPQMGQQTLPYLRDVMPAPQQPPTMAPQQPPMMQPVMPAPQPMPQMPMMPQMPQQNMGRQGFGMAPNVAMFAKGGRVRMADMMKEYF